VKSFAQKKKKNPLPKTARGKKRYISIVLRASAPLSAREVISAVLSNHKEWFGSVGLSRAALSVVSFEPQAGKLVLKCALDAVDDVKAGVLLMQSVGSIAVVPSLVRVSGSLKALRASRVPRGK
jgi:RNase P/RNase MRP subunit POP5